MRLARTLAALPFVMVADVLQMGLDACDAVTDRIMGYTDE